MLIGVLSWWTRDLSFTQKLTSFLKQIFFVSLLLNFSTNYAHEKFQAKLIRSICTFQHPMHKKILFRSTLHFPWFKSIKCLMTKVWLTLDYIILILAKKEKKMLAHLPQVSQIALNCSWYICCCCCIAKVKYDQVSADSFAEIFDIIDPNEPN